MKVIKIESLQFGGTEATKLRESQQNSEQLQ